MKNQFKEWYAIEIFPEGERPKTLVNGCLQGLEKTSFESEGTNYIILEAGNLPRQDKKRTNAKESAKDAITKYNPERYFARL